jgi:mannose-1-phosphate guanylyltransferase
LEKISIDYAVIEKAQHVVMLEASFDWDDVGEWSAIARHYPKDAAGNVTRGRSELLEATNNIVYCRDEGHLVALLGVEDLIVVKTQDATLVCHKDKAQEIKSLVKSLGLNKDSQHLI